MKLSELEGKTLNVQLSAKISMLAELKEIRPIGFFFEVKSCESGKYKIGQHVFMSAACPVTFSTT